MMSGDVFTPASLAELFDVLARAGEQRLVAGGTDFMVERAKKLPAGAALIDLSGLDELRGVAATGEEMVIGALETMTRVSENPALRLRATALSQAAGRVGSWQIRNRATVGGNLAGASPAADTPVALAALGAKAMLASAQGRRELPVEDFIAGPGKTVLKPGEVVTGFRLPTLAGRLSAFGKIGSRGEVTIARLNLAVSFTPEGRQARVFMGTLGSAARRAPLAEAALSAHGPDGQEAFVKALADEVAAAIPSRSTLAYKRSAAEALGLDLLAALRRTAGKGRA